jgi:hypothetical protein
VRFLERQELVDIRDSLRRQKHASSLSLLQGASGAGKTTLLWALADGLENDEAWTVFFLSAQIADRPYASLSELLGNLLARMAALMNSPASVQSGAGFVEEFRRTLAELTRRAPVLIVLDGLDEISFDVWGENQLTRLAEIVRDAPRSHMVLSCRLEFVPTGRFVLVIEPRRILLAGLSGDEFQALVMQLGLPFRENQVRELHRRIHGLPKAWSSWHPLRRRPLPRSKTSTAIPPSIKFMRRSTACT